MFKHIQDFIALKQIESFGEIDLRPMFDGFGLFRDNHYFGVVTGGKLYLRTVAQTVGKYTERHMVPLETASGYRFRDTYEMPPEILADPAQATAWTQEAFNYARQN